MRLLHCSPYTSKATSVIWWRKERKLRNIACETDLRLRACFVCLFFACVEADGQAAKVDAHQGDPNRTTVAADQGNRPIGQDTIPRVKVTPTIATIEVGQEVRLQSQLPAEEHAARLTWTSEDTALAMVSPAGLVTGRSAGRVKITAAIVSDEKLVGLSARASHACGLTDEGSVYCWGSNEYGQLGGGPGPESTAPTSVPGGIAFTAVSAGVRHTCGVAEAGAAYCWGANHAGQFGSDSPDVARTPFRVFRGIGFVSVYAGGAHTCGLLDNGVVRCWGRGPRDPGNFAFTSFTSGSWQVCGLTSEGIAYCWGYNGFTEKDSSEPVPVAGGLTWQSVRPGTYHTCGITKSGEAYCWGLGKAGQLGNDTTTRGSLVPLPVSGKLRFRALATGNFHTCGISADHSLYCWGKNRHGQLGTRTRSGARVPHPAALGLSFRSITAGSYHTCGFTTDETAYCWGSNEYGQLGSGLVSSSTAPVPVAALRRAHGSGMVCVVPPGEELVQGDSLVTVVVGSGGMTIDAPAIASVEFPAGAFVCGQLVKLSATASPETREMLRVITMLFGVDSLLPYEIRVNTGNVGPAAPVSLHIHVPDEVMALIESTDQLGAFAQILHESDQEALDNFEGFPSDFDPLTQSVRVTLRESAFTNKRTSDASYEAILALGWRSAR